MRRKKNNSGRSRGKVEIMKTLSYILGKIEEIEIDKEYYFGQLWDGNGDGDELLESGTVSPDGENVIAFDYIENADDPLETLVKVTDIY